MVGCGGDASDAELDKARPPHVVSIRPSSSEDSGSEPPETSLAPIMSRDELLSQRRNSVFFAGTVSGWGKDYPVTGGGVGGAIGSSVIRRLTEAGFPSERSATQPYAVVLHSHLAGGADGYILRVNVKTALREKTFIRVRSADEIRADPRSNADGGTLAARAREDLNHVVGALGEDVGDFLAQDAAANRHH